MRTTARVLLIACTIVLAAPGTLLAKSAPAAIHDHDFGCELRADSLHPWNPAPMAIPRGVSAKFKLLKAVRSAAESGPGGCTRLPPLAVLARKPGQGNVQWTVIAVGPTQAARCEPAVKTDSCKHPSPAWPHQFKANTHHQIFLNLRNRSPQEIGQLLKNCQVTAWPGRE